MAALSAGSGVWATHFVAMLGYHISGMAQFRVDVTLASLGLVVVGLYVSFTGILRSTRDRSRFGFGILAGLAICAMHYAGMAGFVQNQPARWDLGLVALSVGLSMGLGGICGLVLARMNGLNARLIAAGLLSLTALVVHFIGMAAYSLPRPSPMGLPVTTMAGSWLDPAVVAAALFMMVVTNFALSRHGRDLALRQEMQHMTDLANATIEGLLICDGDTVTAANCKIVAMTGCAQAELLGRTIEQLLHIPGDKRKDLDAGESIEAHLHTADNVKIDVEVLAHTVAYAGRPQTALAVLDIRARKKAESEIRHLANHDVLTQLPNRNRFYQFLREEVERAKLLQKRLALICIDLDNFKEINDLHGHHAGDEFLQRAAAVMGGVLREGQILGRVGGDEFAVLLPDIRIPQNAGKLAEDILAAFAQNNRLLGKSTNLSASLGISIFPDDAQTKIDLLTAADTAMYRAKQEGRSTFRFFDTSMAAAMRERRLIEQELRQAGYDEEFTLVYQPQANCRTGEIIGREALLRWHRPKRGEVPPAIFVPIAEDCGEIGRIGDWALEKACREAAAWQVPLTVAVNVSAVQIINRDFSHRVHEILLQTGLAPKRLEIEITETALIRDFQRALHTLRQIKALGVRITMDDFGTGYSSLYNLRSFPFDKIKIDGSFVKSVHLDGQSAAIVRAVIGLGKGLGIPVLAEGVETVEELDFLRQTGCSELQGYLIGKPSPCHDTTIGARWMEPVLALTSQTASHLRA